MKRILTLWGQQEVHKTRLDFDGKSIDASLIYSILCIFVGGIAKEGGRSHFAKQRKQITSRLLWSVMDGLL